MYAGVQQSNIIILLLTWKFIYMCSEKKKGGKNLNSTTHHSTQQNVPRSEHELADVNFLWCTHPDK